MRTKKTNIFNLSFGQGEGWRSGTNKIGKGWRNPRIRFPCLSCECSCHSLDQRVSRPEPFLSPDLFRINPFTLIVRNQCNQVPRSWFIGKVNDNSFQISNPLRLLSKCTFHFHSVDHARVRRGIGRNIVYVREIFIFFANLIILYSFFFFQTIFLLRKNISNFLIQIKISSNQFTNLIISILHNRRIFSHETILSNRSLNFSIDLARGAKKRKEKEKRNETNRGIKWLDER